MSTHSTVMSIVACETSEAAYTSGLASVAPQKIEFTESSFTNFDSSST
ncbi:hypothetical protein N9X26_03780 [Candidatus Actinomarina sp.]|nr:hypothetical protein [Candidatus Actinomarina sp.]